MGLFSKTVDYNSILEKVLDSKRFSSNVKSLLLSMIYKVEISYSDYAKVKNISKTKDEFLSQIIRNIMEYFEVIKTVEPDSEDAKILKRHKVKAITNEVEKSILTYPTESALLYAIADIEPKYFYIENYIFKKELQQVLVEGSNLDVLEVLEDFTGWSWNPKSVLEKDYFSNIIYQNLILIFGLEFVETCKRSQTTQYDIIKELKDRYIDYYNKLTKVLYLKNKNKKIDNLLKKKVSELREFDNIDKYIEKVNVKEKNIQKNIEKISNLLNNEKSLNKSFLVKNSKLSENKKFKTLSSYVKFLNKEKEKFELQIEELEKYQNPKVISKYKEQLVLYKSLLDCDKTVEEALIDLQQSFIKILYKKAKEIKTKEEFLDIIYRIRYYRNIYISKNNAIKDYDVLENNLNKILKKIITFGTQKSYLKMISLNISLNSKIIIGCLDSKSMELEHLKLSLDVIRKNIYTEVFENKIFEKRFNITFTVDNPEIIIKKRKPIKIFT